MRILETGSGHIVQRAMIAIAVLLWSVASIAAASEASGCPDDASKADSRALPESKGKKTAILEYRMENMTGKPPFVTFPWRDGIHERKLEPRVFLSIADFRAVSMLPDPATPGWDIDIEHTEAGARKFAKVGERDRDQQFSILVYGKIVQSYAFPPSQKPIAADGTRIGPFPQCEAERMVREINEALHHARTPH